MTPLRLHPDRLFPADPTTRGLARELYEAVAPCPILSPHGHTDAAWFATDAPFADAASLLVQPDHYLLRMLSSQGVSLAALGVPTLDGTPYERDPRAAWRRFADQYHLFRGTPSRLWLDWVFAELFELDVRLEADTADLYYDHIAERLARPAFRPRALFDRFNIDLLATTEGALDDLAHHRAIRKSGWAGRVVTTYRPDAVTDPDTPGFRDNLRQLGEVADEDVSTFAGYLRAHRSRRAFFRAHGATATDHGHPDAFTALLPPGEAEALYARLLAGPPAPGEARLFRGHMLTEMAGMSAEDGMTMQLHTGVWRSHDPWLLARHGRDRGADIPVAAEFVSNLKPLLDAHGHAPGLTLILFTLDEATYARELAPLAGHYPALLLGPPWWFHDSPEGMRRFRERTTETAGFMNMAGFNDDTRAFPSIPARHDVSRRMDSAYLARLVAEHQLELEEAHEVAHLLAHGLAKRAYRL